MKIMVNDRVLAAATGAFALWGGGAAVRASRRLCTGARFQAARSALMGRPTAYRLHLHGTGLEFASWERNYVAECVLRGWPESGLSLGPDVEPRPGQGDGSVFRDSTFIGDPRLPGNTGIRFGAAEDFGDNDEDLGGDCADPEEGEVAGVEAPSFYLPAACSNNHNYPAVRYAILRDKASITVRTPVVTDCPECGAPGAVYPGRYFIVDGRLVREDVPAEDDTDE